jgi:hypothetical protein
MITLHQQRILRLLENPKIPAAQNLMREWDAQIAREARRCRPYVVANRYGIRVESVIAAKGTCSE